jgi:hypothetical protein
MSLDAAQSLEVCVSAPRRRGHHRPALRSEEQQLADASPIRLASCLVHMYLDIKIL